MVRQIVSAPNPVLSNPAKTVTVFDKKLRGLIADMHETLIATRNPKGVGLAAVQIGEPWRVFVTKPGPRDAIRTFINPEIISANDDASLARSDDKKMEGCLSIPRIWGNVKRHHGLVLKYRDENGEHHEERFEGFPAVIIQHETDHTNGILYTQRVLEQRGKLFQPVRDRHGKEVLEEIRI